MTKPPILTATLPIELTNGNDGRGSKWYKTAKTRKRLEGLLQAHRRTPFDFPTSVTLTRVLGVRQRLWDADSVCRGNAKELIDALVALGWWHDDGPKYITDVYPKQDATRRDIGPAVEIEVYRSG